MLTTPVRRTIESMMELSAELNAGQRFRHFAVAFIAGVLAIAAGLGLTASGVTERRRSLVEAQQTRRVGVQRCRKVACSPG